MIFVIVVVERTSVGSRIRDAEFRRRVVLAHAFTGYISLEAGTVTCKEIRREYHIGICCLGLELYGISLAHVWLEAVGF